ncbi:MarR family winged helix-turn-helix transcriptional regulator [Spirillospora sp. CA-294931]|uniref:MarR family winged helix-turn-helix transcriptional regulator n=1 Tax=Spirillospora sp. CA-294931 TaxID=3240042 RepID=UPI003D8FDDA2
MGLGPHEDAAEVAAGIDGAVDALVAAWGRAHYAANVPVPATQLRVLLVLEGGPVNISTLAAEMGASMSSASRLCDRLEAAGLLTRDPGRDRRVVTVRLTPEAQTVLERLHSRRRDELTLVLSRMSAPARAALAWGLAQFHEASEPAPSGDKHFTMPA